MNTGVPSACISGKILLPDDFPTHGERPDLVIAAEVDTSSGVPIWRDHYWAYAQSDGTYEILGLSPGREYAVWVGFNSIGIGRNANPASLLTTAYGGYSTMGNSFTDEELSDPGVQWVLIPEDSRNVSNIDILMDQGATITGRVCLPDGSPASVDDNELMSTRGSVVCVDGTNRVEHYIEADGSYSFVVLPSRRYRVGANVKGYPPVWTDGRVESILKSPIPESLQITAPNSGETLQIQDLVVTEGSSISGIVTGGDTGGDSPTRVRACAVHEDGGFEDAVESEVDESGAYYLSGLIPGGTYAIRAACSDWLTTWYGGFVGRTPEPHSDKVLQITAASECECISGIDIELVRAVTIVGTVRHCPESTGTQVSLFACPTEEINGTTHYRRYVEEASLGLFDQFPGGCAHSLVDTVFEDGRYILEVPPGPHYAIIAIAEGYENTWYGGYVGDAEIDINDEHPYHPLPNTDLITLVHGHSGEDIINIDITLTSP